MKLLLIREELHDRRLNERHESHVGVGCDRDLRQKMRRQFHGGVDRHRAVCATDDTDRGRFAQIESQDLRPDEGYKDPQVSRYPQNDKSRIGDHGPEVRHGTDAEENKRRQYELLHALIRKVEKAARRCQCRARHIGHDTGKADPHQQKRFILLDDAQIEQDASGNDHDQISQSQIQKSGLMQKFTHQGHK